MTAQSTAKGIASLGRHGDTLIVHMNPEEVLGLQALAKQQGTSLTINPNTGMPEAFKLGNVFKSLLPVAAGFALGPGGFGLFNSALMTGLTVGGLTGLATGDIGQGLMAGLGAGGGFGLGESLVKNAGAQVAESAAKNQIAQTAQNVSAGLTPSTQALTNQMINQGNLGMFSRPDIVGSNLVSNPSMANVSDVFMQNTVPNQIGSSVGTMPQIGGAANIGTAIPGATQGANGFSGTFGQNFDKAMTGLGKAVDDPMSYFKSVGGGSEGMGMVKTALPLAGPIASGLEYSDLYGNPTPPPEKYKYDPYATLNLGGDSGLRLVAKGGYIDGYATGGTIQSGGIRDLYGTPDSQPTISPGLAGFGLGRLNNLAGEQSMTQAQTLGYAMGGLTALKSGGRPGGYLDGNGDGMSDSIPATIDGKQPARLADGEFVIPADVVSHLGNGSSKAGSKRLYAMLDKVRHARTGNKKQGKQIKPEKYMPV